MRYLFLYLSLALIFCTGIVGAVGTYPNLDSNMILYYHFNNQSVYGENDTYVYDFSGNGNNATIINKAIHNNTGGYLGDGDFIFNGSQYATSIKTSYNFSNGLTVMAWIKNNKLISNSGDIVSRYISQNGNRSWSLFVNNGYLTFAGSIDGINVVTETGNTQINDSNYHFVTGVWNGTELKVFVDGVLDGVTGTPLTSIIESLNVKIEIARARRSQYFNGSIDEVIVLNKSLLDYQVWNYYYTYHGCFIPIDNMEVEGSIYLCNGIYNLNISSINLNADNTFLDCNNSEIYGNYSQLINTTQNEGIHIINNNNITIRNCYLHNFYRNLKIYNSNNLTIFNNTFGFGKSSLYIDANGSGTNISYNNFSDYSLVDNYSLYFTLDTDNYFNNFYVSNNIFSSCDSYCIRINGVNNSIFVNNSFGVFNGYQISDSWNINISNHYFINSNNTYRIYFDNSSGNIYNNQFISSNTTYFTILTSEYSYDINIFNNVFYNETKTSFPVNTRGNRINIYNNNFSMVDGAIRLRSCQNCKAYNNIMDLSVNNNDAYDMGILNEFSSNNNQIFNNTMTNMGSWCVIVRQSNNVSIYNNYCDLLPRDLVLLYNSKDYGEPRGAFAIMELYKSWVGDGSNLETDNITKMRLYNSTDVYIYNNSYGSNVEVYFLNRGGLSNILNWDLYLLSTWFRSFQFSFWEDNTYLWINNNFNNLSSRLIDGSQGIILQQNFRNKNKFNFTITKEYNYFKNTNNSNQGILSLNNLTSTLLTNGTSICNGSSSNLLLNSGNVNITLNPGEECFIYDNIADFQVDYNYTYNQNDQNGYSTNTNFISTSILGMVSNFFSLTPILGTIIGISILIIGIVFLVLYIKKFNNQEQEDTIYQ